MNKNSLLLVLAAIGLAIVYVVWFSDWFSPKTIKIYHAIRGGRQMAAARGNADPDLKFGLQPASRIRELKVVPLAQYETNKDVLPVWHLVSDSNSIPLKMFFYGQYIGGMHSAIKGAHADELESNVTYRMFISTGKLTGQHDFELK